MKWRWAALAALGALTTACNPSLRRGDQLYAEADFVAASSAYDEALAADPADAEAASKRDDARTRALGAWLQAASTATKAGRFDDAVAALGKAFEAADKWQRPGVGATELEQLSAALLPVWDARLEKNGPLSLQREGIATDAQLAHPRFAELKGALQTAWSRAGERRCAALEQQVASSFLAALTRAYCRALGHEVHLSAAQVPVFGDNPKVENFLRGGGPLWPVAITHAFDQSPWAAPQSSDVAALSVSGQLETFYTEAQVQKTATWSVQVPHQVMRWVEVPYTTYEYYTYPCGQTTCSGSRPITEFRSEPTYETEYRTEQRQQQYPATEKRATLAAQVNLFVDLRPLAKPLGIVVKEDLAQTGVTHAAVPAAKLPAEVANVPTAAQWDERMRETAEKKLLAALVEHWHDAFCEPPLEGAEAAARCAYGVLAKPADLEPLAPMFHDDVSSLTAAARFGTPPP